MHSPSKRSSLFIEVRPFSCYNIGLMSRTQSSTVGTFIMLMNVISSRMNMKALLL